MDITGVDLSVNMSHLAFEMLDKVKLKNVSLQKCSNFLAYSLADSRFILRSVTSLQEIIRSNHLMLSSVETH